MQLTVKQTLTTATPTIRTLTRRPEVFTPECPATCEIDLAGTLKCFGKVTLDGACTTPSRDVIVNVDACEGVSIHFEIDGGVKDNAVGKLEVRAGEGQKEVFGVKECKFRFTGKPPLGDRCLFQRETCVVETV